MTIDIVADIINSFVAGGTIATAVIAVRSLRANQKSIDASTNALEMANRQAKASEESIERMKDSLMPHFDLSARIGHILNTNGTEMDEPTFLLTIRNTGTGPGTIRLFTHREDIKYISIVDTIQMKQGESDRYVSEQLIDFTIGAQEKCILNLKYDSGRYSEQEESISSLSLFYEDVYGRFYRARLIYKLRNFNRQNEVVPLGREVFAVTQLPNVSYDVSLTQKAEGGLPTKYVPVFQKLQRLLYNKGTKLGGFVEGREFTGGRPIQIMRIEFGFDGYPVFELMVDEFPTFMIESYKKGDQPRRFNVRNDDRFTTDYREHGLVPTGNDDGHVSTLYRDVLCFCLEIEYDYLLAPIFL